MTRFRLTRQWHTCRWCPPLDAVAFQQLDQARPEGWSRPIGRGGNGLQGLFKHPIQRPTDTFAVGSGHPSVFPRQILRCPIQRPRNKSLEPIWVDGRRLGVPNVFVPQQYPKRHQQAQCSGVWRLRDSRATHHLHQRRKVMGPGVLDSVAGKHRLERFLDGLLGVKAKYPAGRIRFATQTPNHIQIVAGAGKQPAGVIKRRIHEPCLPMPHARRVCW